MTRVLAFVSVFAGTVAVAPARGAEPVRRTVGNVVLEDVPEIPDTLRDRMKQYLEVRSAGLVDFDDAGGGILITTRFGSTNQLHVVDGPGMTRRQITFLDEPIRGGAFVPATRGRKVLYMSDRGGSEFNQVYLLDLDAATTRLLTDGKSRHEAMTVARNGKLVAFSGTGRNGRDGDIYLCATSDWKPKPAWEVDGAFYPIEFNRDATRLSVLEFVSEKESRLHILDVASGKHEEITPKGEKFAYGGGVFSADGKQLYFTTDRNGPFQSLYRRNLASGRDEPMTDSLHWDVESVAVSPAGGLIAFSANEDGQSRLYTMKDGKDYAPVSSLPAGVIGGLQFSEDGKRLGISLNSPTIPGDVFVYAPDDGHVTRWTESEAGGLNPDKFVAPERISYPTFDTVNGEPRRIPAYMYKPRPDPRALDKPYPVIVYIHGGPEGQERPRFSSLFQYWATEMRVAVLIPNVRGSTGYGRDYHMLDDAARREDSVRDIGGLLDWIMTQPQLDAKRVGVYGGSYGGYMVLACLTTFPDRFRAGVDVVGIANFITFLEKTAPYRQDLRRAEYGDERDPEMRKIFERISPLNHADKITAALYVQHGANDPRVPAGEAEQIVKKLREKGRPVWYMLAKDEGHGFAKKENRDLATLTAVMFLDEQLRK